MERGRDEECVVIGIWAVEGHIKLTLSIESLEASTMRTTPPLRLAFAVLVDHFIGRSNQLDLK